MTDAPLLVCPNCSQPVRETAVYCPSCGSAQPNPTPVRTELEPEPVDGPAPWRGREALWLFLVQLFVSILVIGILAARYDGDDLAILSIFGSEIVLIGLTYGWVAFRYGDAIDRLAMRGLTLRNVGTGVAAGLAGVVGAGFISAGLTWIVERLAGEPVVQPDQIELSADPSGAMLVMLGVSVVVLAPIGEEMFFRGFMHRGIRRWAAVVPAVLISSAIFAVSHIIPLVILPIFGLGLVLAWLLEKTGSIIPSIAAHMFFNAIGFWALFLVDTTANL